MEYANAAGLPGGTFAGLAHQSGFTERECALMAGADRLAGIVRVAELRRQRRAATPTATPSGVRVLLQLQELRGRLLDAQLRAAGLL